MDRGRGRRRHPMMPKNRSPLVTMTTRALVVVLLIGGVSIPLRPAYEMVLSHGIPAAERPAYARPASRPLPSDAATETPAPLCNPTLTPTATGTATVTPTPTRRHLRSPTPTNTVTPSDTPTPTVPPPTCTPSAVAPTDTETDTAAPTDTPTDVPSDTPTDTSVPSDTATDTPTDTATDTATLSDTPTGTPTAPADTPTDTPTTPTDSPTTTPTDTFTALADTPTYTPTDTATGTPSASPAPTLTATPSDTPSDTPTAATVTVPQTETTASATAAPSDTPSSAAPSKTATPSSTPTATAVPATAIPATATPHSGSPATQTAVATSPPPATTAPATPTTRPKPRPAPAVATFVPGSIFVGVGGGNVAYYSPKGHLIRMLNTRSRSSEEKGMCIDGAGALYITNFDATTMTKFDRYGRIVASPWGGPFSREPESCVVDKAGHVYVGEVHGHNLIRKYSAAGKLLATYRAQTENVGIDWIDLASDQCTIYYTSEGGSIKRFNVCRNRQLPDFARGLSGPCYGLRLLPDGEVLVACSMQVYRLDRTGQPIQTYTTRGVGEPNVFVTVNLDPDGNSFWTAGFQSGNVYKLDIATGRKLLSFRAPLFQLLGGVAIIGEATSARAPRPVSTLSLTGLDGQMHSGHAIVAIALTAPRTAITVTLQIVARQRAATKEVILFSAVRKGTTDRHGRFTNRFVLAYHPRHPTAVFGIVMARTAKGLVEQSRPATILP